MQIVYNTIIIYINSFIRKGIKTKYKVGLASILCSECAAKWNTLTGSFKFTTADT